MQDFVWSEGQVCLSNYPSSPPEPESGLHETVAFSASATSAESKAGRWQYSSSRSCQS